VRACGEKERVETERACACEAEHLLPCNPRLFSLPEAPLPGQSVTPPPHARHLVACNPRLFSLPEALRRMGGGRCHARPSSPPHGHPSQSAPTAKWLLVAGARTLDSRRRRCAQRGRGDVLAMLHALVLVLAMRLPAEWEGDPHALPPAQRSSRMSALQEASF